MKIINYITMTIAIELNKYLEYREKNPQNKFGIGIESILTKPKLAYYTFPLILKNEPELKSMFPSYINKKLAEYLEKESDIYLNQSNLSKMLKKFKDKEIIQNVQGTIGVSKEFPELHKPGRSKPEKREGFPSMYKIAPTIEDCKRILDNPDAVKFVNQTLLGYGILKPAYRILLNDFLDMLVDIDNPELYQFLSLFAPSSNLDKDISITEESRQKISIILNSNQQIREKMVEYGVSLFEKNPSSLLFFLFMMNKKNYE